MNGDCRFKFDLYFAILGVLLLAQPNVLNRFHKILKFTWITAAGNVQFLWILVAGVAEVENLKHGGRSK